MPGVGLPLLQYTQEDTVSTKLYLTEYTHAYLGVVQLTVSQDKLWVRHSECDVEKARKQRKALRTLYRCN